jgi:hypothetical protein
MVSMLSLGSVSALHAATSHPASLKHSGSLLRLRGGSAGLLTNVGAGIFGASGALAWVSPSTNFEKYGLPTDDASANSMMRTVGCWQMCTSAILLAGKGGVVPAAGFGLCSAALANLANLPNWEYFGREKASQVGGCAALALLGKYTLASIVRPSIAAAVLLLIGGLMYATPKETTELYQVTKPVTPLALSMLSTAGGTILTMGVYVGALVRGLTQPQSLAAAFIVNGCAPPARRRSPSPSPARAQREP